MKKATALLILLLCLPLAGALVLFGLLHTGLATPVVNYLAPKLTGTQVRVELAEYHSPYHFSLHGVEISTSPEPLYIENLQLWLNPALIHNSKLVIDSVLLSGFTLSKGTPEFQWPETIQLNQLAAEHLDYSDGPLVIRELAFQVKNPRPAPSGTLPWFGEWQASADQVYWRGEAVNQLLSDGDYLPESKKIYGLSFKWRGADFSTQAQWQDGEWHLINSAINKLNLKTSRFSLPDTLVEALRSQPVYVQRLDLLDANIDTENFALTQGDLTLEDWQWPDSPWQQNALLSFNAESLRWKEQLWQEPVLDARFNPGVIELNDFNTGIAQGNLRLSGHITPDSAHFSHLTLSGLEWLASIHDQALISALPGWQQIHLDELRIRHSQYIDLLSRPRRQTSGLNLRGKNLQLRRDEQWGLWQGELSLSANSISYGKLIGSQLLLEAHAADGTSYLDKLILPLDQGLVRAQGEWRFEAPSHPWHLKFAAEGLDLERLSLSSEWQMPVKSLADFQFNLKGLGGDRHMLAHSLEGFMVLELPDFVLPASLEEQLGITAGTTLSFNKLTVNADRGRLSSTPAGLHPAGLNPSELTGQFSVDADLATPEKADISLSLEGKCGAIRFDLMRDEQLLKIRPCPADENLATTYKSR